MIRALLAALFVVAGCGGFSTPENVHDMPGYRYVSIVRDDERHVTCWVYVGYGISCLPDTER